MCKNNVLSSIGIILFCSLITACSQTAPEQTATVAEKGLEQPVPTTNQAPAEPEIAEETAITIDGSMEDWGKYPQIGEDAEGDQVPGSPDLASVHAFSNDRFFYMLITLHAHGETDHYDLILDTGNGEPAFQLSVWPQMNSAVFAEFPVSGDMVPVDGVSTAQDEVIEIKMPLALTGGKPVRNIFIQTFLGNREGDFMENMPVLVVDEIDPDDSNQQTVNKDTEGKQDEQGESQDSRPICSGQPIDMGDYAIVEPGTEVKKLWKSEFGPWWVDIAPDGRVLAVTDGGDSIYELKPNGTLEVAFQCPGVIIESFTAASDNALWFASRDGGTLYRADADGTVEILAESGNRNLQAGPDGVIYAMEEGIEKIYPDGTRELIYSDVFGRKFAIGPQGEIAVLSGGKVLHILEDGQVRELGKGYGPEPWLSFAPDGLLYVSHWSSLHQYDLEIGIIDNIDFLKNNFPGESSVFIDDGKLLAYHPNTDVSIIDLKEETINIYYNVLSNSSAVASNPGDTVYVAFGDYEEEGQTEVYRVMNAEQLEYVLSVPFGYETSMAFDTNGNGYLAVGHPQKGGAIFRFDPFSADSEMIYRTDCMPFGLAVDPLTQQVWWENCGMVETILEDEQIERVNGVPGWENVSLAISTAGEFYAIGFIHRDDPRAAYQRRLYKYNEANDEWEIRADLTQSDAGITLAKLTACPDGRIYTVESLGRENLPIDGSSFNAVRRLEEDGSLTLLGYDFSFDGSAAHCDPVNNMIVFTSGSGIYGVTPP
ncbi:MAG: hypothetical protein JEZ06_03665 [Anaerolineaceae bacterium]|nr:hypothetical protein [Anaerolineaceae bacterium]